MWGGSPSKQGKQSSEAEKSYCDEGQTHSPLLGRDCQNWYCCKKASVLYQSCNRGCCSPREDLGNIQDVFWELSPLLSWRYSTPLQVSSYLSISIRHSVLTWWHSNALIRVVSCGLAIGDGLLERKTNKQTNKQKQVTIQTALAEAARARATTTKSRIRSFLDFLGNCFSCFITARITFTNKK